MSYPTEPETTALRRLFASHAAESTGVILIPLRMQIGFAISGSIAWLCLTKLQVTVSRLLSSKTAFVKQK